MMLQSNGTEEKPKISQHRRRPKIIRRIDILVQQKDIEGVFNSERPIY